MKSETLCGTCTVVYTLTKTIISCTCTIMCSARLLDTCRHSAIKIQPHMTVKALCPVTNKVLCCCHVTNDIHSILAVLNSTYNYRFRNQQTGQDAEGISHCRRAACVHWAQCVTWKPSGSAQNLPSIQRWGNRSCKLSQAVASCRKLSQAVATAHRKS